MPTPTPLFQLLRTAKTSLLLAASALLFAACGSDSSGPASPQASMTAPAQAQNECAGSNEPWLAAWGVTRAVGTSLSFGSQEAPNDTTVRNIARVSVAGEKIRLRLINLTDQPLIIESASVAKRDGVIGANLVQGSSVPVTFNCGQPGVVLQPGTESFYSDPVDFAVAPEDHLAISFYSPQGNAAAEYG
ncbi:MAG: hypothetical protein R3194_04200, partial [Limnobacter sp.]|nr:hypothetical protein [Limnobacter sp.]